MGNLGGITVITLIKITAKNAKSYCQIQKRYCQILTELPPILGPAPRLPLY